MFNFLTFMFGFLDNPPDTNDTPYKYNFTAAYIGLGIGSITFILFILAIIFDWKY